MVHGTRVGGCSLDGAPFYEAKRCLKQEKISNRCHLIWKAISGRRGEASQCKGQTSPRVANTDQLLSEAAEMPEPSNVKRNPSGNPSISTVSQQKWTSTEPIHMQTIRVRWGFILWMSRLVQGGAILWKWPQWPKNNIHSYVEMTVMTQNNILPWPLMNIIWWSNLPQGDNIWEKWYYDKKTSPTLGKNLTGKCGDDRCNFCLRMNNLFHFRCRNPCKICTRKICFHLSGNILFVGSQWRNGGNIIIWVAEIGSQGGDITWGNVWGVVKCVEVVGPPSCPPTKPLT